MGGQAAIRGYLVQTLIALLDALDGEKPWRSVTLEPNIESDKVDILWKYPSGAKAVQVKSSRNPFRKGDVERWAAELESWRKADEYELVLVGTPGTRSVAKIGKVGSVSVPPPKNLDLGGFKKQAAHDLDRFLRKHNLDPGDPGDREMLVEALTGNLTTLATDGRELTRSDLVSLLTDWILPATESAATDACAHSCDTARIIRVFVSSPEDVSEERAQLDEICASINRTEGMWRGVRLELFDWERDAIPQIGPGRRQVIQEQTPIYHIYLGIMSSRFGEPAGRHGRGTEREFLDALKSWKKAGTPWITFYFEDQPVMSSRPADVAQYLKVFEFREKLETMGLVGAYKGVRGTKDAFHEKVSEHLRMIIGRLPPMEAKPEKQRRTSGRKNTESGPATLKAHLPPIVPPEYTDWLLGQCGEMELMGLEIKHGSGVLLNHIYTPLVTSTRSETEGRVASRPRTKPNDELLAEHREKPQLLLDLFHKKSLYVSGDPGSGKSTFCRWVTWLMCKGALPTMDGRLAPPELYREEFPSQLRGMLPVPVRLRDFWTHLPVPSGGRSLGLGGLEVALSKWLAELKPPGLEWACLKAHLDRGSAVLMLDGVDEVPSMLKAADREWYPREMLLDVLARAVKGWTGAGNRVLVTSRPYGLVGEQQKRLGLEDAPIQGLDVELQALLVRRWFIVLMGGLDLGLEESSDMIDHLHGERSLDDLAVNPLLLTAMCIIYHEGKRLPEDKYELYDRIVNTVLHKRYPPVKERVSAIRGRLGAIAFGMHTGEGLGQERESPEASASDREMDRLLQRYHELDGSTDKGLTDTVHVRDDLLSQSGLLVSRGDDRASFYHLSFQEFLAAERLFISKGWERDSLAALMLQRGASAGWRNTLSFLFGSVVTKFNPRAGADLLQDVVGRLELPPVDPAKRGQGGSAWNLAIVLGDCLEILVGRGASVPEDLSGFFQQAVKQAIEQEIAVKDRHTLAVALSRLRDRRISEDLCVKGHPDDYRGYVRIPAGRYVYGDDKKPFTMREPFWLSRYPVTNAQYALFMKKGGYKDMDIWSDEGRHWLKIEGVSQPEYWRDPRFSGPDQPVVGVSFWEAEAFARWAGGSLPTERQWEAAARGREGYTYPWGDNWEDGICNSRESGLQGTSAVGIFPRSRSSEFGLDDMAGNVIEWCVDYWDKKASDRVIRGGGWILVSGRCRASYRSRGDPADRGDDLGFRVALVPPGKQASRSKDPGRRIGSGIRDCRQGSKERLIESSLWHSNSSLSPYRIVSRPRRS
jgi:hypothetical protein